MLDVCDGAPPCRQAYSLTGNSLSRARRPCLIALNTSSAVISLARLDGAISSSAFFSNSTEPLSASIRIARGALVWNSSFFAPGTGLAAKAVASASAPATIAAAGHAMRQRLDRVPVVMDALFDALLNLLLGLRSAETAT